CVVDPLRVARFDCRDARVAASRLVVGRPPRRRPHRSRIRCPDPVPAPRESSTTAPRDRTSNGFPRMSRIAILGAGSWGTALAIHLARAGRPVRLWARDEALAAEMASTRNNPRYLSGVSLPPDVEPTSCIEAAVADAQFVVVAVPSHGLRSVVRSAAGAI